MRALPSLLLLVAVLQFAPIAAADPLSDVQPIDRAQAVTLPDDPNQWYDIRLLPLEGRGWSDTKTTFDRLPAKAEGVVRPPVWGLSQHSAGMCVRFATDAASIAARWTLRNDSLAMNHMPATGVSGLDLYVRQPDGGWAWLGVGRPDQKTNKQVIAAGLPTGRHEFLLYLPLYNGVEEAQIGLPPDAFLAAAPDYAAGHEKPIVFYGTSITQGGCASRPGMAYPAILGRRLDRPTINLGFSGNGRAEPEVAALLAELDPAVFVLDCLPNMDAAGVNERIGPLVNTIRAARPDTPIVLVENITYQNAAALPSAGERSESKNIALRTVFDQLRKAGVGGLHYVPGAALLGDDGEGTVDGTHPTDLGFLRMADALEGPLREALGQPSSAAGR